MTHKTSTGNRSTGDYSTGDCSTGNRSTGDCSTGNRSTGNRSTGDYSTGNRSTGYWSISDNSSGHFSTVSSMSSFDKQCTKEEWDNFSKPSFLYFDVTVWVESHKLSDKEKEDNEDHGNTGGYVKILDFKQAFQDSYKNATGEDRKKILKAPNFDADKFLEISGIDVRVDSDLQDKKKALIEKANELLKQAEEL